jgi:hypothetical protein
VRVRRVQRPSGEPSELDRVDVEAEDLAGGGGGHGLAGRPLDDAGGGGDEAEAGGRADDADVRAGAQGRGGVDLDDVAAVKDRDGVARVDGAGERDAERLDVDGRDGSTWRCVSPTSWETSWPRLIAEAASAGKPER